jgi:iron-sulfur cluster repair protein YtfE (RIC family)
MPDDTTLTELTVNETIRLHPATVAVFRARGIDSCCGGALRVADAAARHGIDPDVLLEELLAVARQEA